MKKQLRDEIAMSMTFESIPVLDNVDAMIEVSKTYAIPLDPHGDISLIEFSLEYQAVIRYQYADKMLKRRAT